MTLVRTEEHKSQEHKLRGGEMEEKKMRKSEVYAYN